MILKLFLLLIFLPSSLLAADKNPPRQKIWATEAQNQTEYLVVVELKNAPLSALISGRPLNNPVLKEQFREQSVLIAYEQEIFLNDLYDHFPSLVKTVEGPRIQYRWHRVLNAIAIWIPKILLRPVLTYMSSNAGVLHRGLGKVSFRPKYFKAAKYLQHFHKKNLKSGPLVQSEALILSGQLGLLGAGIKIGVIDTGIDYTHQALGGPGGDLYKNIAPDTANKFFPNSKVLGGVDFVGSDYDPEGLNPNERRPKPDSNPLDEDSHGTHVAAIAAALPWVSNDGSELKGVAPGAGLYALKVFGKNGSASDAVIMQALEYGLDPNGDNLFDDRLDIINLSLGSDYGLSFDFLSKAIKNASHFGQVILVAAGNAGQYPYVIGSPGVTNGAISVGASVDGSPQNTIYPACNVWKNQRQTKNAMITATFGQAANEHIQENNQVVWIRKKSEINHDLVAGKIIYVREEDKDLELIIRQAVANEAKGLVVGQRDNVIPSELNEDDISNFSGGNHKFPLWVATLGNRDRKEWESDLINQYSSLKIELPCLAQVEYLEREGTVAEFSSEGPEGLNFYFRPHFLAPGENIQSAKMKSGSGEVMYSGTSMSTPHAAGVFALLLEKIKRKGIIPNELVVQEIKDKLMASAFDAHDFSNGGIANTTWQGAGIIQAKKSLNSLFIKDGHIKFSNKEIISKQNDKRYYWKSSFTIENKNNQSFTLNCPEQTFYLNGFKAMAKIKDGANFSISENEKVNKTLLLTLSTESQKFQLSSLNPSAFAAHFKCSVNANNISEQNEILNLPFLGRLEIHSNVTIKQQTFINKSQIEAHAFPFFPLLSFYHDAGKNKENICSIGEILTRVVIDQRNHRTIEFLIKGKSPLFHLFVCETSLFVYNSNGLIQYELSTTFFENTPGIGGYDFEQILFDVPLCQALRHDFEMQSIQGMRVDENYSKCLISRKNIKNSDPRGIVFFALPLSKIKNSIQDEKLTVSFRGQINQSTNGDNPIDFSLENNLVQIDLPSISLFQSEYVIGPNKEISINSEEENLWYIPENNFSHALLVR